MNIETAQVFAEAFSGVGTGATWAFIAWAFFDFLKETLPYVFFGGAFFVLKRPVKEFVKRINEEDI